jgi:hypothetical protein
VGFYAVESWRGNATWKAYRAEARAHGVKLMLAEYVPPPVPDNRNFAAIPLFQDAFKEPQPPDPLALPKNRVEDLPPFNNLSKNTLIDLGAWQKHFVETKFLPSAGENAATDVLAALEHYAPQFEQLRVAGARPECHFPVHYEDGISTKLPHLQLLRSGAQLHALRLAAHLALGQSDAAYEDFRGGLRLYTAAAREPTLIAGLVRLSVLGIMENAVWGGLARRQWDDAALQKIIADFASVRLMDDYALGLGSERGFSNMIHEQLVEKGTGQLADLLAVTSNDTTPRHDWPARARYSLYPTGWVRRSQTRSNRYIDEMLLRVTQEPPRIFPERTVPSDPVGRASLLERCRYLLFLILAPALGEVERNYAYAQTLLDETRLGCALERHRLAHGNFPASLDALAPAYLAALPHDVMNGTPLHYRMEAAGGYTLYSVAWNLQDDGGKADTGKPAKAQPDWVWRIGPSAQP